MAADPDHFPSVAEFLGGDWLEVGCAQLEHKVSKMTASGMVDNSVESDANPIHQTWYAEILGKTLPGDLIMVGDYGVDHRLRRLHRLLTLEQLLRKLSPTWDEDVAASMRGKLRSAGDFESTLYELQVVLNFREAGHDVNINLPTGTKSPDIGGTILGVPASVECKRVTFRAKPHRSRLKELNALAESVLSKALEWGRTSAISIELSGSEGTAEIHAVREAVESISVPPVDLHRLSLPGPASIQINTLDTGEPRLVGELSRYDVLKVSGRLRITGESKAEMESLNAVGVIDYRPSDWAGIVRSSLNTARRQLQKGRCNIICLEVADMSFFTHEIEACRVFQAVESFLDHDTRRVSGVIATSIGVINDEPAKEAVSGFRSASQSWLISHLKPAVKLPKGFESPGFDLPMVRIRASQGTH